MEFIQPDLETILSYLNKLDANNKPLWGKMNAQRMVEHLSEIVLLSISNNQIDLLIPVEKIEKMQGLLASDTPMPRDFQVPYAPEEFVLKNEELELAVDEFIDAWLAYEEYYEINPSNKKVHPFYGELDKSGWDRMHSKHFTHHFEQFGLL